MQPLQEIAKFTQRNELPGGLFAARDELRRVRGERDRCRDDYTQACQDARSRNDNSRPSEDMQRCLARLEAAEQRVGRARVAHQAACQETQVAFDIRVRAFRAQVERNLIAAFRDLALGESAEDALHNFAIVNSLTLSISPLFNGAVNYRRILERLEREHS